MVTALHGQPKAGEGPPRPGPGAGGGWRSLVPPEGRFGATSDRSPEPSRTGIWVGLAAIGMSFAAFTSALLVRQGSTDWQHFALPRILYLNTVLLFASSITLEVGRRRVASLYEWPSRENRDTTWLALRNPGLRSIFCGWTV